MAGKNKERSLNPVLAMRKNQRKRELKKTKLNKVTQRNSMLKQKSAQELISEMENIDMLETESIRKGYFNENTLREKKYKIRQTIIQMISLYDKENKEKSKEIKTLLSNYDLCKSAGFTSVENPISKCEDEKQPPTKDDIMKLLPNIPLPSSSCMPVSLLESNKIKYNHVPNVGNEEKNDLLKSIQIPPGSSDISSSTYQPLPSVSWLPMNLKPAPPPPFPPHSDSPALPGYLMNAVFNYAIPCPVYTPNIPSYIPHTLINQTCATNNPSKVMTTTNNTEQISFNANYTAESTLSAEPVLKDLQAEVIKLVPTTLQIKRSKSSIHTLKPLTESNVKSRKENNVLEDFMNEINDIS